MNFDPFTNPWDVGGEMYASNALQSTPAQSWQQGNQYWQPKSQAELRKEGLLQLAVLAAVLVAPAVAGAIGGGAAAGAAGAGGAGAATSAQAAGGAIVQGAGAASGIGGAGILKSIAALAPFMTQGAKQVLVKEAAKGVRHLNEYLFHNFPVSVEERLPWEPFSLHPAMSLVIEIVPTLQKLSALRQQLSRGNADGAQLESSLVPQMVESLQNTTLNLQQNQQTDSSQPEPDYISFTPRYRDPNSKVSRQVLVMAKEDPVTKSKISIFTEIIDSSEYIDSQGRRMYQKVSYLTTHVVSHLESPQRVAPETVVITGIAGEFGALPSKAFGFEVPIEKTSFDPFLGQNFADIIYEYNTTHTNNILVDFREFGYNLVGYSFAGAVLPFAPQLFGANSAISTWIGSLGIRGYTFGEQLKFLLGAAGLPSSAVSISRLGLSTLEEYLAPDPNRLILTYGAAQNRTIFKFPQLGMKTDSRGLKEISDLGVMYLLPDIKIFDLNPELSNYYDQWQ